MRLAQPLLWRLPAAVSRGSQHDGGPFAVRGGFVRENAQGSSDEPMHCSCSTNP